MNIRMESNSLRNLFSEIQEEADILYRCLLQHVPPAFQMEMTEKVNHGLH